jgi:hypothetical protein
VSHFSSSAPRLARAAPDNNLRLFECARYSTCCFIHKYVCAYTVRETEIHGGTALFSPEIIVCEFLLLHCQLINTKIYTFHTPVRDKITQFLSIYINIISHQVPCVLVSLSVKKMTFFQLHSSDKFYINLLNLLYVSSLYMCVV